jgi:CubicO group peptidase (beta-lactamase class C family)
MDAFKTALGLKSSMQDMLHFISHLSFELEQEAQDMSNEFIKEIKVSPKSGMYKMAHGWFLISSGSSVVYFHNGHTSGHYVNVAFIPELHLGVVVMANGAAGPNDLSLSVLSMLKRARR